MFFFFSVCKLNKDLCTKVFLLFLLLSFVSETSDRRVKRRQEAAFLGGTFRNFITVLGFFQIFSCLPPFFYIIKTFSMRKGDNIPLMMIIWCLGPAGCRRPTLRNEFAGEFSHRNICYHSMNLYGFCSKHVV